MRYLLLLAFLPPLVMGSAGASVTARKLHGMRQIRGFAPGASSRLLVVTDKWLQPPDTYWISWGEQSIRRRGPHRLNLPRATWDRIGLGDEVEIVYLPNDPTPYYREGIYASDGNFALDYGLLVFEFGLMLVALAGAPIAWWFLRRFRPT